MSITPLSRITIARVLALSLAVVTQVGLAQPPGAAQPADWAAVEAALGRKGALNPGEVMKFGFPRSDLAVTVAGVRVLPTLALGSWLAFLPAGTGVMVMGDLVLTEDEVAPVMRSLQQNGVDQTALHNHLVGESPSVLYMHVHAMGDGAAIARAVRAALELTRTPLSAPAASTPPAIALDTMTIARTLGATGKGNGGVYQVSIPRPEKIMENGHEIPPAMGLATAINFQPTGAGRAAVTGDFVLTTREVSPVTAALRDNAIQVTAIHSHLVGEEPRLYFVHFWANEDAIQLARGLKAALDRMAR